MEKLRNKTILTTGGAGFIGSHLCEELINLGAKVICVDNFSTGKKENISHLLKNKKFVLIKADVNEMKEISRVFARHKIDYIFHYAAVVGVKRVLENPLVELPDIFGIKNILELSRKYKVKKIIFSSSSEAYGFSTELPLKEDSGKELLYNKSDKVHLYALVKLMGERMMKTYNDFYGLPTCSLRFFNVFGPRQESSAYGFVVGVFIKQILNNQRPTVFGAGYQTRDFIYVKDNVRLAIKALISPKTNGQLINIGSGRQTTIIGLAERLIRISGKKLKPKFIKSRGYEIMYRSPDTQKMKKLLGEKIKDNLDKNLKITYEWYFGRE